MTSRVGRERFYFMLTLEERKALVKVKPPVKEDSLPNDVSSSLEALRAYQLSDILGKYKLF